MSSLGPWRVDGKGLNAMVRSFDSKIVCVRHRLGAEENESNMRKIAVADEMFDLLLEARDKGVSKSWFERRDAVIKKAMGEK